MHFGKGRLTLLGIPLERMGMSTASHTPAQKLGASKKWLSLVWPCQESTVQGLIILGYISLRCLKNRFRSKQSHHWDCRDFLHPHPLTSTTSRGPRIFSPSEPERQRLFWHLEQLPCSALCRARGLLGSSAGRGRKAGGAPGRFRGASGSGGADGLDSSGWLRPHWPHPQARRLHTRLVTHRGTLRLKSSPGRIPDGGTAQSVQVPP